MSVELYDDAKQAVPEATDRLTYRDMSVTPQSDAAYNATVRETVNAGLEVVTGGAGTDKDLVLRDAAAVEVGRLAVVPVPVVGTAAVASDYDDGLEHLELTATPVVDRWHVYRRVGAGAWTLFRRVENVGALATSEMVLSGSGLTTGTAYDLAARGERLGVVGPLTNIVEYTWGGALPAAVLSGSPGVVVGASMLVTVTLSTAGISAPALATFTGHKMYVRPCGYPWRGADGWEEMGASDDGNPRVLDLDLGTWELAARWVRNGEEGPLSYLAAVIGGGAAPNEGAVATAVAEQTSAGVKIKWTIGSAFTNARVFYRLVGAAEWTLVTAASAGLSADLGMLAPGSYEARVVAETGERYSSEAVAVTWDVERYALVAMQELDRTYGVGAEVVAVMATDKTLVTTPTVQLISGWTEVKDRDARFSGSLITIPVGEIWEVCWVGTVECGSGNTALVTAGLLPVTSGVDGAAIDVIAGAVVDAGRFMNFASNLIITGTVNKAWRMTLLFNATAAGTPKLKANSVMKLRRVS